METEAILLLFSFTSVCINASIHYKIGKIEHRVETCENYKVTPKGVNQYGN